MPSLRDVLAKFPGVLVTLDLKDQRVTAVKPLCAMAHDLNLSDSIYIGVDTTEHVMEFRTLCPLVRTSGTDAECQASRHARDRGDDTFRSTQTVSQPDCLAADGTMRITKQLLDFAHARNVAVQPHATRRTLDDCTVNSAAVRHHLGYDRRRHPRHARLSTSSSLRTLPNSCASLHLAGSRAS